MKPRIAFLLLIAIAAVSGYSLAQVQMSRVVALERAPTPTVEEMQRALENRTGEPYPLVTPTATVVNAAGTPEPPSASVPLPSATPSPLAEPEEAETPPAFTP